MRCWQSASARYMPFVQRQLALMWQTVLGFFPVLYLSIQGEGGLSSPDQ